MDWRNESIIGIRRRHFGEMVIELERGVVAGVIGAEVPENFLGETLFGLKLADFFQFGEKFSLLLFFHFL